MLISLFVCNKDSIFSAKVSAMDKVNIDVNVKDIPIPSQQVVKKLIIRRTYDFLVSLRWKVLVHLKPDAFRSNSVKETYGFRSEKFPSNVDCEPLKGFERDLWMLVKNVEFRTNVDGHMKKLYTIVNKVRNETDILVKADKTRNYYRMSAETYKRLHTEELSKNYKKADATTPNNINKKAKLITDALGLSNRVQKLRTSNSYILIKDHKEDFQSNPKFRLIHGSNQDISRIAQRSLKISSEESKPRWVSSYGKILKTL